MNMSAARIESNRAFELMLGAGVVPVVIHFDDRKRIVSVAERVIEFQCLAGPLACSGDIYPIVPITIPGVECCCMRAVATSLEPLPDPKLLCGSTSFANPKSRTFA